MNDAETAHPVKIRAKVSTNLLKDAGLPTNEEKTETQLVMWVPPENPGLDNSSFIIPPYYRCHERWRTIDFYAIVQDDIRNFRKLTRYQMDYIRTLPDDKKNELFEVFNVWSCGLKST